MAASVPSTLSRNATNVGPSSVQVPPMLSRSHAERSAVATPGGEGSSATPGSTRGFDTPAGGQRRGGLAAPGERAGDDRSGCDRRGQHVGQPLGLGAAHVVEIGIRHLPALRGAAVAHEDEPGHRQLSSPASQCSWIPGLRALADEPLRPEGHGKTVRRHREEERRVGHLAAMCLDRRPASGRCRRRRRRPSSARPPACRAGCRRRCSRSSKSSSSAEGLPLLRPSSRTTRSRLIVAS